MKILLSILAVILALVLLLVVIGLTRPAEHTASVTDTLAAPVDSVWAVISNIEGQTTWLPDMKKVERLPDHDGHPAYSEDFAGWPMRTVITESVPNRRMVKEILPSGSFSGSWTWELAGDSSRTQLTITERGRVGNPIFRALMLFGDNTKTMREYMAALARRLGG